MGTREYNESTGELKFFDEAGNLVYHRPSRQKDGWLLPILAVLGAASLGILSVVNLVYGAQ